MSEGNSIYDGPSMGDEERDPELSFPWTPCPDCAEPLCHGECAESLGRNTDDSTRVASEGISGTQREETIPCKWCGRPTAMLGTKCCDKCWELSTRIEHDPALARKMITEYE